MICEKCKVEMVYGKAIKTQEISRSCFISPAKITAKNLVIIDCLKCPKCGHSDDGEIK